MRDRRFVAVHRGGALTTCDHKSMAMWAAACAEHVLATCWSNPADQRPAAAVEGARAWARGEITVGAVRQAALSAHDAAKESRSPQSIAAARAAGHAAATAHMADHCLRASEYALKAAELVGVALAQEHEWQDQQLPAAIRELVNSARQVM